MSMKFHRFTFHQLVGPEISAKILDFFYKGLTKYLMFPEERYLQKSKKIGEIIKLFNMPSSISRNKSEKSDISRVSAKKATKKAGAIDIASSQGCTTVEVLWYDHDKCPYFDEGNLTEHKNHEILMLSEKFFDTPEYQFYKL